MARYAYERGRRFTSIAAAGDFGQTPNTTGAGVSSGAGDEIGFTGNHKPDKFSFDVIIGGTGSFTALEVDLEFSDDGVNWFVVASITNTAGGRVDVANKPTIYARCKIPTAPTVASGAPTINAGILAR